jgi:hypothetical protein
MQSVINGTNTFKTRNGSGTLGYSQLGVVRTPMVMVPINLTNGYEQHRYNEPKLYQGPFTQLEPAYGYNNCNLSTSNVMGYSLNCGIKRYLA